MRRDHQKRRVIISPLRRAGRDTLHLFQGGKIGDQFDHQFDFPALVCDDFIGQCAHTRIGQPGPFAGENGDKWCGIIARIQARSSTLA